ncbi:hypothetical protein EYF80_001862 [Liparis tanakae]|uniref:Uncharacterized protein n=1 Tax=Liparis tanakae TaxID=230148 RepID=A0A4Z2JE11_9TELE|nr:hypothetical protein EYF80_001862 [Liparis tanakae]
MDPSTKPAAKDEHPNAGLHIACGRSGGAGLYPGLCSGRGIHPTTKAVVCAEIRSKPGLRTDDERCGTYTVTIRLWTMFDFL